MCQLVNMFGISFGRERSRLMTLNRGFCNKSTKQPNTQVYSNDFHEVAQSLTNSDGLSCVYQHGDYAVINE